MIPSHHHLIRHATEQQHIALAEAAHERLLAQAATGPDRLPDALAPDAPEPRMTRRLWLPLELRPRFGRLNLPVRSLLS